MEAEPESDGSDDEDRGSREREDGFVRCPGQAGEACPQGERSEAVMEAVRVVDSCGNPGVGAGHHRGDGEHGRREEVDVAHTWREAGSVGDAAEHLAEQQEHRHRHGQREHQQLRDAGAGAQVAADEGGKLVTDRRRSVIGMVRVSLLMSATPGVGEVLDDVVEAGRASRRGR